MAMELVLFKDIVEILALIFAVVGSALIGYGGLVATYKIVLREIWKRSLSDYNQIRREFTSKIVFGLNGVGKTTTIGKLAHQWKGQGLDVMLVAGDTFRAAAIEQLALWGERAGVPVVRQKSGSDPSAVAFDAIDAALARGHDVVIMDTACRMHTKVNLMEEVKKVQRVITKKLPEAPHEVLLVLDATTGQNALSQARQFKSELGITGLVLTKLDGTAKGGVVAGICQGLQVPVRFIGIGEGVGGLQPFDPEQHRRESFGQGFESLCSAIAELSQIFPNFKFVYPVHLNPNVREPVYRILSNRTNVHLIEPVAYLEFEALMLQSKIILTVSGGVQEEAPTLGKPILVMRENTERPEALSAGCARLVGTDKDTIVSEVKRLLTDASAYRSMSQVANPYGDGKTSDRIARIVHDYVARSAG